MQTNPEDSSQRVSHRRPAISPGCRMTNTLFPLWQDMRTDATLDGCANFPGATCGVFTSVTGSAPNRIFNIEWRTVLYWDETAPQNFEVRLYENDPNGRFDVVFGTLTPPGSTPNARGCRVSRGTATREFYTADFCVCWPDSPPQNQSRTYTLTPARRQRQRHHQQLQLRLLQLRGLLLHPGPVRYQGLDQLRIRVQPVTAIGIGPRRKDIVAASLCRGAQKHGDTAPWLPHLRRMDR